jgi:hypothetical protein
MKHRKDVRNSKGQPLEPNAPHEVQVLAFTMVERSPNAFKLRFVWNEDLIRDLRAQGTLDTFLDDAEDVFSEFRNRLEEDKPRRPQRKKREVRESRRNET